MSDLRERLLKAAQHMRQDHTDTEHNLYDEAADEIERLRAERDEARAVAGTCFGCCHDVLSADDLRELRESYPWLGEGDD